MSILIFQQWVNFQVSFGLKYGRFWNFGKPQSFRSSSPLSVTIRIKLIRYQSKKIWPKYQNSLEYFHARIFSIFGSNESLFLFMFPHIFDSLNSSKATSQLIFTLGISRLHVCMLSSFRFNFLQEKNIRNKYILEKTC